MSFSFFSSLFERFEIELKLPCFLDRAVALAAGSRYLTDVDLDFDRVLRDSGKFTDIHVSRIDAQIGERGVGGSFPHSLSSDASTQLTSPPFLLADPEKDQAGRYSYLMSTCGFHSWMQVLAGGAPEETQRMGVGVSRLLSLSRSLLSTLEPRLTSYPLSSYSSQTDQS